MTRDDMRNTYYYVFDYISPRRPVDGGGRWRNPSLPSRGNDDIIDAASG